MILIILRGPAGSGKSSVSYGLKDKIKNEKSIEDNDGIYLLNLDETRKDIFEDYMVNALNSKYVIGEMFSDENKISPSNGHTTNPDAWINRFKDKHYNIFSFILKVSIETWLQRCKNDEKKNRDKRYEKRDQHEIDHNLFYKDPQFVNFYNNANIDEETVDTETTPIPEVVDIIYSKIKSSLGYDGFILQLYFANLVK